MTTHPPTDLVAKVELSDLDVPGDLDVSWKQTVADWHQMLAGLDPATAPDDHGLVHVVTEFLQAGVIDTEVECAWRRWAYEATGRMYPADFEACAAAAGEYSSTLRNLHRYEQAVPVQHDVVSYLRRYEDSDVDALLLARTEYARLLHVTGTCLEAAHEISTVWQLWLSDAICDCDTEVGWTVLDTCITILLGCGRVTDLRHILTSVPPTLAARRAQERDTDADLVAQVVAHAAVCTHALKAIPATVLS